MNCVKGVEDGREADIDFEEADDDPGLIIVSIGDDHGYSWGQFDRSALLEGILRSFPELKDKGL